jgi:uncharacterized phage-associated protein
MVNVFDIAKYILHINRKEISTTHLQKLCYYCRIWHLAWYGKLLFPEDFERWDNDPVCKQLFHIHHGWFSVEEGHIPQTLPTNEELSETNIDTVEQVIHDCHTFNAAQLSELARQADP